MLLIEVHRDDRRPSAARRQRVRQTEALRSARDENDLSLQHPLSVPLNVASRLPARPDERRVEPSGPTSATLATAPDVTGTPPGRDGLITHRRTEQRGFGDEPVGV
jgi:hypothetical protein